MTTTRRGFLTTTLAGAAVAGLPALVGRARAQATVQTPLAAGPAGPVSRRVPKTSEPIPAVGLGTWITFNVGEDTALRDECAEVMAAFFAGGGRMIDSSPMYGSAQGVVGYGLDKLGRPQNQFAADKVWTSRGTDGPAQIERSRREWGIAEFDLLQVHNLLGWEAHLPTLAKMKEAERLRYVGITTSEGRRHDLVEEIMRREPIDFVQFSYNVRDREAEERLLPLAADRGIAVIVNRPFRQGALTRRLDGEPLPGWAEEIGATTWAQALLKFVLAHPAVTTVIPATTSVAHVRENLAAATGTLPDEALRRRIIADVEALA